MSGKVLDSGISAKGPVRSEGVGLARADAPPRNGARGAAFRPRGTGEKKTRRALGGDAAGPGPSSGWGRYSSGSGTLLAPNAPMMAMRPEPLALPWASFGGRYHDPAVSSSPRALSP